MKTVYIPKGTSVHYESLVTECLVVKGHLQVTYGIKAKRIVGNGVICAGTISADTIRATELEAASITCDRLIAKRVQAPEVFAAESAAVSGFLSSAYVETGKLTVAISEVDEVKAEEVVNLPLKKRTLLGTLLRSTLRSFWTVLTVRAARNEPVDADYKPIDTDRQHEEAAGDPDNAHNEVEDTHCKPDDTADVPEDADCTPVWDEKTAAERTATDEDMPVFGRKAAEQAPVDEELNRVVNLFKLARDSGYTLRIVPGTPEENAPVFDFGSEHITKPAA